MKHVWNMIQTASKGGRGGGGFPQGPILLRPKLWLKVLRQMVAMDVWSTLLITCAIPSELPQWWLLTDLLDASLCTWAHDILGYLHCLSLFYMSVHVQFMTSIVLTVGECRWHAPCGSDPLPQPVPDVPGSRFQSAKDWLQHSNQGM